MAARVPFDDRINNKASLNDLDLGLIREYLQEIKSELFEESTQMPFTDLCKTMLIAKGPNEDIRPVNVGLLFFSKHPEQFFDRSWIELVWHEDNSGKKFQENYFKGPIQKQLRDVLSFIQSNIIRENVVKSSSKAESDRFYNFPFEAIEEALSNAVYHKNYELGSPIEIQVLPNQMTILSHPGPVAPVNAEILSTQKRIIAREYRNRRIGDFLKELRLTEGRGTGFPTIYNAMVANESPEPSFETDDSTYVLVTLPVHISDGASDGANNFTFNTLNDIISYCDGASDGASKQAKTLIANELHDKVERLLIHSAHWIKRKELFAGVGLSNHSTNRKKYLDPLITIGWIKMEYPDKPTHPNQQYRITESGEHLRDLIKEHKLL